MRLKRQNFTLLEMVMALAVFAVVMSTVGMMLFTMQRTWQKNTAKNADMSKMQMIDRIVDSTFRNAVPFHWKDRNNQEIMIFEGKTDALLLTYLHRIGRVEEGGLRFIRFYCKDKKLMVEYRRSPILPDQEDNEKVESEVLAQNIRQLSFKYADLVDNKLDWYEEWDTAKMRNIPMAIQMKIVWENSQSEVWLRRTAGNSQFHCYGQRLNAMPQ